MNTARPRLTVSRTHHFLEVLGIFTRLGITAFGGPVAHLAYFRQELVERRGWLSDVQYSQLLALCQMLPGPASSQAGFCLGLFRAGWLGGIAAFLGFTLPSATLMILFASFLPVLDPLVAGATIHGLKLVAVAIVAQAVIAMRQQLCPDPQRISIAALSGILVLLVPHPLIQLMVIPIGGLLGYLLKHPVNGMTSLELPQVCSPRASALLILCFLLLLTMLPVMAGQHAIASIANAFFRAGALVFGGGHVVLPMLEQAVVAPGWVNQDAFLAGYGGAQAVPGPLFTFAAYLGAMLPGGFGGIPGALLALVMIFLPGLMLVTAFIPLWQTICASSSAQRLISGVNAAVVGLLAAALYDPLWRTAVNSHSDVAIVFFALTLLLAWRISALYVVMSCVLASLIPALMLASS